MVDAEENVRGRVGRLTSSVERGGKTHYEKVKSKVILDKQIYRCIM